MSRASNSLKATDVTATPIKLKYSASYSNTSICDSGIYAKSGVNGPVTVTGSIPDATLYYRSIRQLFYSNYLTGSYQASTSSFDNFLQSTAASGTLENNSPLSSSADIRYFPTESGAKIKIISVPTDVFGEKISRQSFSLTALNNTSYNLVDDGNGNLVDTLNNNVHVGNIIYSQGFVIITNADYYCVADGGPTTFPKSFQFDITDNPKVFNPIIGAIPDCGGIDSGSVTLKPLPGFLFPETSINGAGQVTLDEADPITNEVGLYKDYYQVKSQYCAISDPQIVDVRIVDCTLKGFTVTEIQPSPSITPTRTPTKTPTKTPSITVSTTPTKTPTKTPSVTASTGASPTKTPTPTKTPSTTPTKTPSLTVSNTVTPTPTKTPTPTPTEVVYSIELYARLESTPAVFNYPFIQYSFDATNWEDFESSFITTTSCTFKNLITNVAAGSVVWFQVVDSVGQPVYYSKANSTCPPTGGDTCISQVVVNSNLTQGFTVTVTDGELVAGC